MHDGQAVRVHKEPDNGETQNKDNARAAASVSRMPLHGQVVPRLRTMINEGELKPGSRIPERVLCETFGISRTPLREALRVLAAENLVVLTPNRGATVTKITSDDVDELFPVMGVLEALSGELACERMSDDDLAEIRADHYQMALHYKRRELSDYFRFNQRIHEKILEIAGNKMLSAMHEGMAGRISRARYSANLDQTRWDRAMGEHNEILAALEARDGKRLADLLRQHLHNKCETVKEALRAEASL